MIFNCIYIKTSVNGKQLLEQQNDAASQHTNSFNFDLNEIDNFYTGFSIMMMVKWSYQICM